MMRYINSTICITLHYIVCDDSQTAWRPLTNTLEILTTCFSTAPTSLLPNVNAACMTFYSTNPQNRKLITYCIVVRKGPSHGHRQHVQKISWSLDVSFLRHAIVQTGMRTRPSQYLAPLCWGRS